MCDQAEIEKNTRIVYDSVIGRGSVPRKVFPNPKKVSYNNIFKDTDNVSYNNILYHKNRFKDNLSHENIFKDTGEVSHKNEFEYDEETGKIEGTNIYMVKGKNGNLFPVAEKNLNNIDEENFEYGAGVLFGHLLTYQHPKNPHNLKENVWVEFIKLSKENQNYILENHLPELKKCQTENDFLSLLFKI